MLLNDLVVFPDLVPLELDDFIDKGFGYTCAQVVVLRFFIQRNGNEVLVNGDHEAFKIHFLDKLVHVFGKFEQALDNQTGDLWLVGTVLVLSK